MSSNVHRYLYTTILSVPPLILIRNKFLSTFTVKDDSMQPCLKEGDVVLVRKCDFFPYYQKHGRGINDLHSNEDGPNLDEETDRDKLIQMNMLCGRSQPHQFNIWTSPPLSLPGDVVVFMNPQTFSPIELEMKRVIGLGGQRIRPKDSYTKITNIRPYSLWLESDKKVETCKDSTIFGCVNKNLVVGQVDCIIWPPSRWSKVRRERPAVGRAWWP